MPGARLRKRRAAAAACSSPGFPAGHVQAAVAQLDLLGALERKDGQLTLTPVGRKMAAFPLDPKFAKVSHLLRSVPLLSDTSRAVVTCAPGALASPFAVASEQL